MNTSNFEFLHQEHTKWLSEIRFWREEIKFLRSLCHRFSNQAIPDKIYFAEVHNDLNHHERLLNNMESQIHSHENFLKEMIHEQMDHGITDHDNNRQHIKNFERSFREIKKKLFKVAENKEKLNT